MSTLRRTAVASGAALLLLLPAGCGDPYDKYCSALAKDQQVFVIDGPGNLLIAQLPKLQKLAEKAPEDLRDEWQTFLGGLDGLRKALDDAGVDPGEFSGTRPANVTDSQWSTIRLAADNASSEDVAVASNGIDQQARDVCKLQLGL